MWSIFSFRQLLKVERVICVKLYVWKINVGRGEE